MQHGEDIRAQEFQWREEQKKEEELDNQASEVDTEPDYDMDPANWAHNVVNAILRKQNLSRKDYSNQNETTQETAAASNETEAVATVKSGKAKGGRWKESHGMGIRSSPPRPSKKSKCRKGKSRRESKEEEETSGNGVADLHQPVKASKISVNSSSNTNEVEIATSSSGSSAIKKPTPAPANSRLNQNASTPSNAPSNAATNKYWSNEVQEEWDKLLK
eukprot:2725659-Rhodomonas_salina.1